MRMDTNTYEFGVEETKAYYERQIKGLIIMMEEGQSPDIMVARSYVNEKLKMILIGGINFHPSIKKALEGGLDNG